MPIDSQIYRFRADRYLLWKKTLTEIGMVKSSLKFGDCLWTYR